MSGFSQLFKYSLNKCYHFLIFYLLGNMFFFIFSTNCSNKSNYEDKKMRIDNFSVEFHKLDKDDDEEIGNLVSSISQSSYTIPLELINLLHTSEKNDKEKAAIMVLELGNLVFTPLLHSLNSDSHNDYVWDIKSLVNIQIENRNKLAKLWMEC